MFAGGGGVNLRQPNKSYILKYPTHQITWLLVKLKSWLTKIQPHCFTAIYNNLLPTYQKMFFSGFEIVLLFTSLKTNAFASFKALYLKFLTNSIFIFQVIPILVSTSRTPLLETEFLPDIVLLESASKAQCKLVVISPVSSTSLS